MVSIRGNSETRDDAAQNALLRPAKQPILQADRRKKGPWIEHKAPLCALADGVTVWVGTAQHSGQPVPACRPASPWPVSLICSGNPAWAVVMQ